MCLFQWVQLVQYAFFLIVMMRCVSVSLKVLYNFFSFFRVKWRDRRDTLLCYFCAVCTVCDVISCRLAGDTVEYFSQRSILYATDTSIESIFSLFGALHCSNQQIILMVVAVIRIECTLSWNGKASFLSMFFHSSSTALLLFLRFFPVFSFL